MPFEHRDLFLEEHGDYYLSVMNALTRVESELDRRSRTSTKPRASPSAPSTSRPTSSSSSSPNSPNTVFWIERRPARRRAQPRPYRPCLQHPPAGHPHRRLRAPHHHSSSSNTPPPSSPPPPSPSPPTKDSGFHPHHQAPRPTPSPASSSSPRTSTTKTRPSSTCPPTSPTPAIPTSSSSRRAHPPRPRNHRGPRLLPLHQLQRQMRQMHDRMLSELPYPLLLHGTAPRHVLLQQFRETPNAILFGTSSFWQGVDVQGEQLSCVIIDRLPFAVPTDPVVKARMEAIEAPRRQALLRLPDPPGRHHPQTGLRPPHPLAQRSRRPHAPRPPHPAPTLRPHLPRIPPPLSPHPIHRRRRSLLPITCININRFRT